MAKKTAAELKAEGAELSTLIAAVRKRPHNFALLIGKEGLVLEAHHKKGPDLMRRQAKANGGGAKGTQGTMTLAGKILSLHCEDDRFPSSLPKQAKKHFAERGLAYRILMVLPGGGELSDEEGDEEESPPAKPRRPEEDAAVTGRDRPRPPDAPMPPGAPDGGTTTTDGAMTGAEEALLAKGGADFDASVATATAPPPGEEDADAQITDREAELLAEIRRHAEIVETALKSRNSKAATKVETLGSTLRDAMGAQNYDRAAATLTLLVKTANDVAKRFPPDTAEQVSGPITMPDWASSLLGKVVDGAKTMAEDVVQAQRLSGTGLSDAVIEQIVQANRDDPKAVETALADVAKLSTLKVQPADMSHLLAMKTSNPKTYGAAIKALETMDASGSVDLSPEAVTAALKTRQDLYVKRSASADDFWEKDKAKAEAAKKSNAAEANFKRLEALDIAAKKAVTDWQAANPPPYTAAQQTELAQLTAAASTTGTNLATAQTQWQAAFTDWQAKSTARSNALTAWKNVDQQFDAATEVTEKIDEKRDLLKALNYGVLSEGGEPPLDDATKGEIVAAYGTSPDAGAAAIDLISDGADPALIAKNVGFVADKAADGFADKDGNKIAASDEDRGLMAANAMRMGAREGQDYFDGFKGYLESGKQLKPDPSGGDSVSLDDGRALAAVNTKRSAAMAGSLMDENGKVDFSSEDAKTGMDHMMFHPGSLRSPAMSMIDQIRGLEENFADDGPDGVGTKMQATLDATALPAGGSADANLKRDKATKIVQGTVGRTPPPPIGDLDAKEAVMSAMISPLSQGPVGSCFTTAPVRKVRMQDPARAMGEFSKIASTGMFKAANGKEYPANNSPSVGENPLMRSWEYSVANAAFNESESNTRSAMSNALFGGATGDNLSALDTPDLFGAEWDDTNAPDGTAVDGMKTKIRKAIESRITFNYDAGPARSTGGGDGRSKSGIVEIVFDGTTIIDKQADFVAAIKTIALETTGETATSDKGKKIVEIVEHNDFVDAIVKSRGASNSYMPWNDAVSVFGRKTTQVLEGGTPMEREILAKETAGQDPGVRTRALLDSLGAMPATDTDGNPDDRPVLWTENGNRGANHNFALLPEDPSFKALRTGDMAANIQSTLLDPGAEIAAKEIPAAECASLFEDEVLRMAQQWELHQDTVETLLGRAPTEDMTSAELKAHIRTVLNDAREAEETDKLAKWVTESNGGTASGAAFDKQRAKIEEETQAAMDEGIDTALVDRFSPPEVVIGDSNWGGANSQEYFVIAPDPASGDLKLWIKDGISGKLKPADDSWTDAMWAVVDE